MPTFDRSTGAIKYSKFMRALFNSISAAIGISALVATAVASDGAVDTADPVAVATEKLKSEIDNYWKNLPAALASPFTRPFPMTSSASGRPNDSHSKASPKCGSP